MFERDPMGLLTVVKQVASQSVSLEWDKLESPEGIGLIQHARDFLVEADLSKADLLFVTNMSWMARTMNDENSEEYHKFALMMLTDLVKFYATKSIVDTYDMIMNITSSGEIN